jgi:hypothetical protein
MMVRLAALAFTPTLQTVCGGDGTLAFGKGLSDPEEPDAWLRDFTGATRLWIEVGPARRRGDHQGLPQGGPGRALCLPPRRRGLVERHRSKLTRPAQPAGLADSDRTLAATGGPRQALHATASHAAGGHLMLGDAARHVDIEPLRWK